MYRFSLTKILIKVEIFHPPPPHTQISVAVTHDILIGLTFAWSILVKNSYTEFHGTLTNGSAAVTGRRTDRQLNAQTFEDTAKAQVSLSVSVTSPPQRHSQCVCLSRRWAPHGVQRCFFLITDQDRCNCSRCRLICVIKSQRNLSANCLSRNSLRWNKSKC